MMHSAERESASSCSASDVFVTRPLRRAGMFPFCRIAVKESDVNQNRKTSNTYFWKVRNYMC